MAYDSIGPEVLTAPLPLICDDKYHEIDIPDFIGKASEEQFSHVYLNVEAGFDVADQIAPIDISCPNCGSHFNGEVAVPGVGRLRIKMQREPFEGAPADDTFYYDLFLHKGFSHLDSRVLMEMAEKNRITHWEYKVTGATSVVLSTRFVKQSIMLGQVNL
jgi:hypothetical protein